ncbi:Os12g0628350 [Oryza sativa Japonica Group]|uniref:Os12g0628350 protein n=1 Tax=Oryza sativa subsp. japonica TaxID=39947 RepID=A0A0P0YCG6_ORYSJ|nr:Os12g0628350 [Oryza sativa Japonica Group]
MGAGGREGSDGLWQWEDEGSRRRCERRMRDGGRQAGGRWRLVAVGGRGEPAAVRGRADEGGDGSWQREDEGKRWWRPDHGTSPLGGRPSRGVTA